MLGGLCFFFVCFKQKTAYEIGQWLEFRRVLFRSLESKMVRQRLSEFKLTPEQVNQRMSQLSDAQVHQVAMQIRTMNPGGDGGLGILVALLVIGILVLLF